MAAVAPPPPPNPPGDDLPQAPSSANDIPEEETRICKKCGHKFPVSRFSKKGAKKTTIRKQCDECRGIRKKSYAKAKRQGADVFSSPTRRGRSAKRLQGQPSYAQPIASSAARTTAGPRPLHANAPQAAVNPTPQRPPLQPADRPLITLGSPITPTPPSPPCGNTIQGRGRSTGAAVGNGAGRGTEPPATVGSAATRSSLPGSRISIPTFLSRGQYSPDPPEVAAARRDLGAIQRHHRADCRAGQQPSSTPSLSLLVARRSIAVPRGSTGFTTAQYPCWGPYGGPESSEQPYFIHGLSPSAPASLRGHARIYQISIHATYILTLRAESPHGKKHRKGQVPPRPAEPHGQESRTGTAPAGHWRCLGKRRTKDPAGEEHP